MSARFDILDLNYETLKVMQIALQEYIARETEKLKDAEFRAEAGRIIDRKGYAERLEKRLTSLIVTTPRDFIDPPRGGT